MDALLEHDFIDGEGITDLLQFIDYNWADDQSESIKKVFNHSTGAVRTVIENKNDKEYEVLDAKQFNKVSSESLLKQSGELSNSTVKIAEFLSLFSSGMVMVITNLEKVRSKDFTKMRISRDKVLKLIKNIRELREEKKKPLYLNTLKNSIVFTQHLFPHFLNQE